MIIELSKLKMPVVSPAGVTAMELITSGDYNLPDLCKIISHDPILTATLIKYANSSRYSQRFEVTNINRAINVLGIKALSAAVIVAAMRTYIQPGNISEQLWEHCQSVATIAKLIAQRHYPHFAEDIELPALVHDMGALVLASNFPKQYVDVAQTALSSDNDRSLSELEKETFGVIHDEVTAHFIGTYRLPELTKNVLTDFHLRLPLVEVQNNIAQQQTAIIALAHQLEENINSHSDRLTEVIPDSLESLQYHLGLTDDDIENFIEDYDEICQAEE